MKQVRYRINILYTQKDSVFRGLLTPSTLAVPSLDFYNFFVDPREVVPEQTTEEPFIYESKYKTERLVNFETLF